MSGRVPRPRPRRPTLEPALLRFAVLLRDSYNGYMRRVRTCLCLGLLLASVARAQERPVGNFRLYREAQALADEVAQARTAVAEGRLGAAVNLLDAVLASDAAGLPTIGSFADRLSVSTEPLVSRPRGAALGETGNGGDGVPVRQW